CRPRHLDHPHAEKSLANYLGTAAPAVQRSEATPLHTSRLKQDRARASLGPIPIYSGSDGSLNNTVSLMLPCPNCGKFGFVGSAGSSVDAVSSGGNSTSEFKNSSRLSLW